MLILTRQRGEAIHIGDTIRIVVLGIRKGQARLGIDAPPHVPIRRGEDTAAGDAQTAGE